MAQRFSDYERRPNEHYPTPPWVTRALLPFLPRGKMCIWEPAAGDGCMAAVLEEGGHQVVCSDLILPNGCEGAGLAISDSLRIWRHDFLTPGCPFAGIDAIITNPPYGIQGRMAVSFIEQALAHVKASGGRGVVAMLLKVDFDSACGRVGLFRDNPAWARKVVLLERIEWFKSTTGHGPSENHAWFVWDAGHEGAARVSYAP